jgi:HSP20 family molecular chaperone IbpA
MCSTGTNFASAMNPMFANWGEKGMNSNWNFPSTFGGFPSTFGGNFPSTFGGNSTNWPMWNNNWSNFGSNWPMGSPMGSNFSSPMGSNWFSEKPSWWNKFYPTIRDASFRPTSMAEFFTFNNPIHTSPMDGSRMLYLCFDVKGFKPEEIKCEVCIKERCITVTACHEVKEKEHTVSRNYTRKFVIPAEYCADLTKCEIKCNLTFDGMLCVEGFLPKMTAEELKTLKEKCPTKSTNAFGAFCPAGFSSIESTFGCAIPIKMN